MEATLNVMQPRLLPVCARGACRDPDVLSRLTFFQDDVRCDRPVSGNVFWKRLHKSLWRELWSCQGMIKHEHARAMAARC